MNKSKKIKLTKKDIDKYEEEFELFLKQEQSKNKFKLALWIAFMILLATGALVFSYYIPHLIFG